MIIDFAGSFRIVKCFRSGERDLYIACSRRCSGKPTDIPSQFRALRKLYMRLKESMNKT